MMQVLCETLALPPVDEAEAMRYARCGRGDGQMLSLLRSCAEEMGQGHARVCYACLPCIVKENEVDFGLFSVTSGDLAGNLRGCRRAVLFAATLGMGPDRLSAKYQLLSPARAVMLQALGAERIESGCDAFCRLLQARGMQVRPRFSPGYGDVALSVQRHFFSLLQCEKLLGLYLSDSLLMSPSKSVTAFVGVEGEP